MKKVIITVIIAAFVFGSCQQTSKQSQVNPNQEFDVVIQNGRVMDPETNFDAVRNVGIKDGKIAVITEETIKVKKPLMLPIKWFHPDLSISMLMVKILAITACKPCKV